MTEAGSGNDVPEEVFAALKARAEGLERQLAEAEARSVLQLRQTELKAEALRAGIVDLDGLRLLDPDMPGQVKIDPSEVIGKLRREKPWLFGATNSSSAAVSPSAAPARRRLATDMSLEEWRTARAELLRRR